MIGKALAAAAYDLDAHVRDRVLARIAGPIGDEARAAIAELATLASTRERRAQWAAAVRVPVPPGIRNVHATWIEALLQELPAPARAAIATGGHGDRATVWLARWATATIPAMPAADRPVAGQSGTARRPALFVTSLTNTADSPVRSHGLEGRRVSAHGQVPDTGQLQAALARPEAELARWLHDVGADQLAHATSAAGPVMLAAMTRRYPAVDRALERIAAPPRLGQLGPTRAAIARCRGGLDDTLLLRIGARCLAPYLARDPVARRRLVLRFARPIGLVLDVEVGAHVRDPLDQVPTLAALLA